MTTSQPPLVAPPSQESPPAHEGQPTQGPAVTTATHRTNNLDALRLVGALVVILGHAYALVGRPIENPIVTGYPVQALGVVIFFSISGYLITASWSRNRSILGYTAARCLRIFPALILVVVVCAFVIGPIFTTLDLGTYLRHPATWTYLDNIILRPEFALPGVWADAPYPVAVNGSLWTLPVEFFCYVMVPLVFLTPRRFRIAVVGALLLYALWLSLVPALESPIIWHTRIRDNAEMWVFFAAGAMLRLLSERGLKFRADVAVVLFGAFLLVAGTLPQHTTKVAWIALPYVVMTVGLASTPYVRRASRFGDFSYGLYLWAFPVQQIVVDVWGVQRMVVNLVVVTLITLLLAMVSWHAVEHPCLRLKDRILRFLARRRALKQPTG